MAARPCPWGSIGRFVSSYITAHAQACAYATLHTYTHTHSVCDIAPPGQRPHYRDRFQSCPILASVGPQTKPWHGVTLTKQWNIKITGLQREDGKKWGEIWDLWVWRGCARTVGYYRPSVCWQDGIIEYHLYLPTPTHTERLRGRILHWLEESVLWHVTN